MNEKLNLSDSLEGVLFKMSEDNIGALNVCLLLLKEARDIDPEAVMGGVGHILGMDNLGLRGPKIWMLYKDVCREDLVSMVAVLRGQQLGFVTGNQIIHALENRGAGLDIADIHAKVCKSLPKFTALKNPVSL